MSSIFQFFAKIRRAMELTFGESNQRTSKMLWEREGTQLLKKGL